MLKRRDKKIYTGKGRILVMDDDTMLKKSATRILKRLGYTVLLAKDGAEAVSVYKKHKKNKQPIEAVILDLTVPGGLGGKETIKKLKKIDPKVKGIVSSGYSNDPVVAHPKKFGFPPHAIISEYPSKKVINQAQISAE